MMKNDDVLELNGTAFGASSHVDQIPRDYDLVDTASPLIDGEILEGFIIKKAEADDGAVVRWLSLLHNFIQLILNSGSAQVQILLTVCRRFAIVRISDNDPRWK